MRLKISEFYQISFFTCPEWSKMYVFNFKPNFQHYSKFLDFVNFILWRFWVVETLSWSKFKMRLKISEFYWILPNFLLSETTYMTTTQIPFFKMKRKCPSKNVCFWQIFNASETQNFLILQMGLTKISEFYWILPNFLLRMSRVVKNVCFWQIFNVTQNFLIFPNFILCRFWVVKNLILYQIYNMT